MAGFGFRLLQFLVIAYVVRSLFEKPRVETVKLSSVSCFGVRFSVMFHFMFVHYTFSSVWVAEWPPFGK